MLTTKFRIGFVLIIVLDVFVCWWPMEGKAQEVTYTDNFIYNDTFQDQKETRISTRPNSLPNASVIGTINTNLLFQDMILDNIDHKPFEDAESGDDRMWLGVYGYSRIDRDPTGPFIGFQQDLNTGTTGGTIPMFGDKFRVGAAGGYVNSDLRLDNSSGDVKGVSGNLAIYASYKGDNFFIGIGTGGSYQKQKVKRPVLFRDGMDNVNSEPDGYAIGTFGKAYYDHEFGSRWRGRAQVAFSQLKVKQNDHTDDTDFVFSDVSASTWRVTPTFEVTAEFDTDFAIFWPQITVGWSQQWAGGDRTFDATRSGQVLTGDLDDPDEGFALVNLSLETEFTFGIRTFVAFSGAYGGDQQESGLRAGFVSDF